MNQLRGGDRTRDALLAAATKVFAERGYDGASVREITRRARANLGAITYHFGSKAALFEQVLLHPIRQVADRLERAAADGGGDALDRIEAAVTAHFRFLAEHPEFRRLVLQVLASDRSLPASVGVVLRRVPALLADLIRSGQREGTVRSGDPMLLTVSVISQPLMLNAMRPVLRAGPGLDLDDPATRERALANALRFIRAGLAPSLPES